MKSFLSKNRPLIVTSASIALIIPVALTAILCSCQTSGTIKTNIAFDNPEAPVIEMLSGEDQESSEGIFKETVESTVYSFNFDDIVIRATQALDLEIRNCNLYMDMYGDLIILGEFLNDSSQSKTDMEITIDFFKADGSLLEKQTVSAYANYIQPGKRMPFYFIYSDRKKFMDIAEVEIGINYNNYNKDFRGLPVISGENFYYRDDVLIINGSIQNIGESDVEDLKLFCTFYDLKNEVVFIREGYLEEREIGIFDRQDFEIKVLMDDYIQPFTHHRLGVFFRDSFKVEEI